MPLLDFNSLVICNEDFNIASLSHALTYFRSCGIKNFIVSRGVDLRDNSPHYIKTSLAETKQAISNIKVRGAKIRFIPHIHIHEGTAYDYFTPHLKAWGSDLIFLQIPLLPEARWLDPEMNFLLYKLKLRPVFVNYEWTLLPDKNTVTSKLFKSPNVDFCFDINYILSEDYEARIHQAMTYGSTLIPCISNKFESYENLFERFHQFRERVGDITYLKLCRHINVSCRSLWQRL